MGTGTVVLGDTGYAVEWVKVSELAKRPPEQRGIAAPPGLVGVAMDVEEAKALANLRRDMGRPRVIVEGYDAGDDLYQTDR